MDNQMTSKLFSQKHVADLNHNNMEILKTKDIKEEALDIVDLSVNVSSGMKYEENAEEETNIKIEINDIQDEGELELNYEQLRSIKIEDAFHKRDCGNECMEHTSTKSCISLDKLETDNGKCIKDIEIIKPEPKEEIDTFDDMETQNTILLWEHNYCKYEAGDIIRHCKYKNNSQRHLEFDTQEPGLSSKNMAIVQNEDIKEEVTNIVDLSSVNVRSDIENVGHITHEFDIPYLNEVGLELIKYEENIKEEISTSYDTEMGIKTEVNDIKDEDIDELDLSYEQVKSIKIEDEVYKRDCSNEYLEHTSIKSCTATDKLEPNNIQYDKNIIMIKPESNEEKDTSDDIEVDLEKQNKFLQWEHNYCKYETVDVKRHSKYTNIIQRHLSHLQQQESNLSYKNMDSIKTEDIKEEVIDTDDSSSTERSDIYNSGSIEVNMKKQNTLQQSQHDYSEYKMGDLDKDKLESGNVTRNRRRKNNIERCQSQLPAHRAEDKSTLESYIKVIYEGKMKYIKCQSCEHITKHESCLKEYFTRKHIENTELYQCSNCKYKTKLKKDLVDHCRLQLNKTTEWFQCHLCDFKTKYRSNFKGHHRVKHNDAAKIFNCEQCDFKTKYKKSSLRHHETKHNDAAEIFHCEICGFETKLRSHLLRHHKMNHDVEAEVFHCEVCSFKSKDKHNLLKHHKRKHDDAAETFHCKLCNFKTKYKGNLFLHHRTNHDDAAEIFHCELCDYKTKYKHNLLLHHKSKHDDAAEIFHCELCDYKTKFKYHLSRHHKRKHDAIKIIHCELCDFKTKYKAGMSNHRKKHVKE